MYCVIINKLAVGGAERLVVDEVNEFRRRGIPVDVLTLKRETVTSLVGELTGEAPLCIPFASLFDVGSWWRLVKYLRRKRYRTVMTHLWFANTVGRLAAFCARVPVVVSFEHNVYDSIKTHRQFFVDRLLQYLSTHIVAVSDAVRESLVRHGIDSSRIVVVLNGIDLTRFTGGRRSEVRAALGMGNEFAFLFVGRLVRQKGADLAIGAIAQVPDASLYIVGEGHERRTLEDLTKRLSLGERVRFLGSRRDVPDILSAADAFVFPSRWEGFGIALAEACASGLPIIASDLPAVRTQVEPCAEALIVTPEDITALVSAFQSIRQDSGLRDNLAAAAKKRSHTFSISAHVNALTRYV